ncbi:MAG TPA: hypothetical protein VLY24_31540 [Bryobacteraceae bacterium]|nr:hypothetical protein [Bryobacteraceae bacterium]
MSDQTQSMDPGCMWRDQPEEELPVDLNAIVNRRAEEMASRTRSEILMSIVATLVLIGMVVWRLQIVHEGLLEFGLAASIAWVAISLYSFRRRIWRETSRPDAFAATGLEHYRRELIRRRDSLGNAWLWHGPLLLALLVFLAVLMGRANVAFRSLENVLPLLILLAAWIGFGIWRRRLQVRGIQQEIDELV